MINQAVERLEDTLRSCQNSIVQTTLYLRGNKSPHYPVPALIDNADTAANWLCLSLCMNVRVIGDTPCDVCIDRFIDGLC